MLLLLLLHCVLWSWQEEEEVEEVCGAPGLPVAPHTLKQNNIVTALRSDTIPTTDYQFLSAVVCMICNSRGSAVCRAVISRRMIRRPN